MGKMGCRAQGIHTVGCRRDRTIHLTQRPEDFCFTKDSSGKGCALEENNSCFQSRIEEEVEVMDVYYSSLKLCIPTEKRQGYASEICICLQRLSFLSFFNILPTQAEYFTPQSISGCCCSPLSFNLEG